MNSEKATREKRKKKSYLPTQVKNKMMITMRMINGMMMNGYTLASAQFSLAAMEGEKKEKKRDKMKRFQQK